MHYITISQILVEWFCIFSGVRLFLKNPKLANINLWGNPLHIWICGGKHIEHQLLGASPININLKKVIQFYLYFIVLPDHHQLQEICSTNHLQFWRNSGTTKLHAPIRWQWKMFLGYHILYGTKFRQTFAIRIFQHIRS